MTECKHIFELGPNMGAKCKDTAETGDLCDLHLTRENLYKTVHSEGQTKGNCLNCGELPIDYHGYCLRCLVLAT